ncbi:MAG: hypothetical protein JWQ76_1884 [Ramlibacter sp.]|nr:hypothetical protein [Ramlibacter sp.]
MTLLKTAPPRVGSGLSRPECVLAMADGRLYASDRLCGVARVFPEPRDRVPLQAPVEDFVPNGIAVLPDGTFLMANIGPAGGVWRLTAPGKVEPFLVELGGKRLPPTNFVQYDSDGRVWCTVSTRRSPRELAFRSDVADGFVICKAGDRAQVVADGIGFANEGRVSPDGQWFYVNETMARRVSRFRIVAGPKLEAREIVYQFDGNGVFPDGLGFDQEGGVYVISVVSNRIIRIKDGSAETLVEDCEEAAIAEVETAFRENRLSRAEIDVGHRWSMGNCSSVAFGGPDLKTMYIGSLFADSLAVFPGKYAGVPAAHWQFGRTVLDD